MSDQRSRIDALRRKAADKGCTPQEAKALRDKANELEAKYKPPVTEPTVLSREEFSFTLFRTKSESHQYPYGRTARQYYYPTWADVDNIVDPSYGWQDDDNW